MVGEWQEYTLGALTDWSSGGTPSKDNPVYWGGAIPWISASSMKTGRLYESDRTITDAGLEHGSRLAQPGAVLLLVRGSELHKRIPIGIAVRPVAFNQDVKALLPRAGIESSFLYYWLSGNANLLLQKVEHTGIGAGKLDTRVMQALPIQLPPLPEQRAIAHILGTLDDKIELNRRMNETLEAMARALFKSWFIDFDPVRRKAARARNQPSPRSPLPLGEGQRGEGAKHEGEGGRQYRGGYNFSGLLEIARELRRKHTPVEELFWELVRDRQFMGLKFRRQHQLGDYLADFYCHEHRLVIELDGGVHSIKLKKDRKRDAWMEAQGFKVLRIPNERLLTDPVTVFGSIADAILPSPLGRRAGDEGVVESRADFLPLPLGEGRGEGSVEELDRLFPDSFEDSELGEIPKGWATRELKEVLTESNERIGEVKAPEYSSTNNGLQLRSERFKKELSASSAKNKLIRNGFLVFGLSRRVLNFGLMRDNIGSVSSAYKVFAVNEEMVVPDLLKRMMRLQPNYFYNAVSASSREGQSVSTEGLGLLRFVQPAPAVQDAFYRITDPLSGRINALQEQSRSLIALRDTLLPKLTSGELRLKDAKEMTEED